MGVGAHKSYDKDEAVRLYLRGLTLAQVGAICGVSDTAILRLLRKRGIERRPPPTSPKFGEAEARKIAALYQAGTSADEIAKGMGVACGTITSTLRRLGVEQRSHAESRRRYQCDHDFFSNIDNEEKAYWLGFVAADGYVTKAKPGNNPELKVSLAIADKRHLYRLKDSLRSTYPIYEYDYSKRVRTGKATPYASFLVRSERLAADLTRYGIVPAKTHSIRWPQLRDDLLRHYLRGVFDGDGHWGAPGSNMSFRLTSNRLFLEGCQGYLMLACGLRRTKLSERQDKWKGTVPTLIYGGRNQVSRIFHLMYDDATIWLPRKRGKAAPYVQ